LPEVNILANHPGWTARLNLRWLDRAIARGDQIWLVTDPAKWRLPGTGNPGSFLFTELYYLAKRKVRIHIMY